MLVTPVGKAGDRGAISPPGIFGAGRAAVIGGGGLGLGKTHCRHRQFDDGLELGPVADRIWIGPAGRRVASGWTAPPPVAQAPGRRAIRRSRSLDHVQWRCCARVISAAPRSEARFVARCRRLSLLCIVTAALERPMPRSSAPRPRVPAPKPAALLALAHSPPLPRSGTAPAARSPGAWPLIPGFWYSGQDRFPEYPALRPTPSTSSARRVSRSARACGAVQTR